jgi:hypothetical protein
MSAKLKLSILLISIFATVTAGIFFIKQLRFLSVTATSNKQSEKDANTTNQLQDTNLNPDRNKYKEISLAHLDLHGSDPATLAKNIVDDTDSELGTRKVEIAYPQPNQALVTITKTQNNRGIGNAISYRVELTSVGRSLLINSQNKRLWQIVWVGSKEQCLSGKSKLSRC